MQEEEAEKINIQDCRKIRQYLESVGVVKSVAGNRRVEGGQQRGLRHFHKLDRLVVRLDLLLSGKARARVGWGLGAGE